MLARTEESASLCSPARERKARHDREVTWRQPPSLIRAPGVCRGARVVLDDGGRTCTDLEWSMVGIPAAQEYVRPAPF